MKRLSDLLAAVPNAVNLEGHDSRVGAIATDSRTVRAGDLFIAIPGVHVDGYRFIPDAVRNGAVVVVSERPAPNLFTPSGDAVINVQVSNARKAWGWLCAAWHGFPSRKLTMIGITGTDGKTTTVSLVYAILRAAGLEAGMINTVAARMGASEISTGLHTTTPDAPDIQRLLDQMVHAGATHAVLEVTSHGLSQHRVAGCDFDVAAVTNITPEHLDSHGTFAAYRQAKARLFKALSPSFQKPGIPKLAVLNRDDESYCLLHSVLADRQISYSAKGDSDLFVSDVRLDPDRTRLALHTPSSTIQVETRLVGAFNISNVLAAASVAVGVGVDPEAIREGIASAPAVPGRMERVEEGQGYLAIVDFAHTPNALKQALTTVRGLTGENGRVIVVFGCAGLRDSEKRTAMGRVAAQLADHLVITAEDPRTEVVEEIVAQTAMAALDAGKTEGRDLFRVLDRGQAILRACRMAQPGDVIIACGKGHEQSMCFGTTEYPWDDREAMRKAIRGSSLNTLPTAPPAAP